MSEDNDIQLERFRFTESFSVEFFVEAENYQKAYSVYSKMFDKNIQLGDIKESCRQEYCGW